jgi:murein DD-endopeptidase MepM/ murein hydrolase activator NlpD
MTTTAPAAVHPDDPGPAGTPVQAHRGSAAEALATRGREVEQGLQLRAGYDLANLTEQQFEEGLARIAVRDARLEQVIATVLRPDVHYGNPLDRMGKPVFQRRILYKPGAEKLRTFFRYHCANMAAPVIEQSKEWVSVTVRRGISDSAGRLLAERTSNCNTLEKRFEKRGGGGYTFTDARQKIHDCLAMAEKRADGLLTLEVTGASAVFYAEEELDRIAAEQQEENDSIPPWTADDKQAVLLAARAAKVKSGQFDRLVMEVLGRRDIHTGADVTKLLTALQAIQAEQVAPIKVATDAYAAPAHHIEKAGETFDEGDDEELEF